MKPLVEIIIRDVEYAERLCNALNGIENNPFETVWGKEPDEYFQAPELLLLDENAEKAEIEDSRGGKAALLTEEPVYSVPGRLPAIYKYQCITNIQKEIVKLLGPVRDIDENRIQKRTRYIGVASPVGGCGKTLFCLSLGQILAQKEKTMYVSLEPIAGYDEEITDGKSRSLSELLYDVHTESFGALPESFTTSFRGLQILQAAENPEDIFKTEASEFRILIEKIAEIRRMDTVILELGADCRLVEEFARTLSVLFVPGRGDAISDERRKRFCSWAEGKGLRKTVCVCFSDLLRESGKSSDPFGSRGFNERVREIIDQCL